MKTKLLSIIIPVYNLEKYIRKCLDSIVSQVGKETEIILIDDGSTDKSSAICYEYVNKYPNVYYIHQQNQGVSAARNHGLKKAKGTYIWFVDGDDWLLPNCFQEIISKLRSKKQDALAGRFIKSHDENIVVNHREPKEKIDKIESESYPQNLINLFSEQMFTASLACNIFKREIFQKNQIELDETVKYTEDIDCCLKLFLASKKIGFLSQPIYVYRQDRDGSATSNISIKKIEDNLNLIIRWSEYLEQNSLDVTLKQEIYHFLSYEYTIVLGFLYLLEEEEKNKIESKVKEYQWILKYGTGKKVKLVKFCLSCLGYRRTGKLLARYIQMKQRW